MPLAPVEPGRQVGPALAEAGRTVDQHGGGDTFAIETTDRPRDAGAVFVKLGWMDNTFGEARSVVQAAVRGVAGSRHPACQVVVALFAEHLVKAPQSRFDARVALARETGAAGLLIDTVDKHGPRLDRKSTRLNSSH